MLVSEDTKTADGALRGSCSEEDGHTEITRYGGWVCSAEPVRSTPGWSQLSWGVGRLLGGPGS